MKEIQIPETAYNNFVNYLNPFGSLDLHRAIGVSYQAGKNEEWLFDELESFCNETETKIANTDICYIAYDSIFQEARNEIEEATGEDICNDFEFYTYGNGLDTSYYCYNDEPEDLLKLLKKAIKKGKLEIDAEELNSLNFFLSEIDILEELVK